MMLFAITSQAKCSLTTYDSCLIIYRRLPPLRSSAVRFASNHGICFSVLYHQKWHGNTSYQNVSCEILKFQLPAIFTVISCSTTTFVDYTRKFGGRTQCIFTVCNGCWQNAFLFIIFSLTTPTKPRMHSDEDESFIRSKIQRLLTDHLTI